MHNLASKLLMMTSQWFIRRHDRDLLKAASARLVELERVNYEHEQAMKVLRQIASLKRKTREQRLASSCVHFLDSFHG